MNRWAEEGRPDARAYARVPERLPVRIRPLTEIEATRLAQRLSDVAGNGIVAGPETGAAAEPRHSAETIDFRTVQDLLLRVERLERLVITLAGATGLELPDAEGWIEAETATLSGGGVLVASPLLLPEGAAIELDFELPPPHATRFRALGRVVNRPQEEGAGPEPSCHLLGISFIAIPEADRELVIRHTFSVQRALLRDRSRSDNSDSPPV